MAGAARAASAAAGRLPARESASSRPGDLDAGRPRLDVVERGAASRTRRRQVNVLRGLGVLLVVGALAATAAAHALVASDQQRIDTLQGELTQSLVEQQGLQLSRAQLGSPVRVLRIAEHQLGMVVPGSVSYLPAVDPGPSVAQAGAAASKAASKAGSAASKARDTRSAARDAGTPTRSAHHGAGPPATTPPTG